MTGLRREMINNWAGQRGGKNMQETRKKMGVAKVCKLLPVKFSGTGYRSINILTLFYVYILFVCTLACVNSW